MTPVTRKIDPPIRTSDRRYVQRFWRVPVVAVVVALLALALSYAFGTSYAASTTLLVRAGNTTFLSNTGGTLGAQGATINPTVSKSIADTESALLGNDTVATQVVDQLHLTVAKTHTSLLGHVKDALKNGYDYLVHGSVQKLEAHAQAVQNVQKSLSASQLSDSFLIGLTATGASKAQVVAVDNAAANDLVALIAKQSQSASVQNRNYLASELTQANLAEQAASNALSNFAGQNGIAPSALNSLFNATTQSDLQAELTQNQADLKGVTAQLQSDRQALAATTPTSSSKQQVQTGRSSTQINQTAQNPNYQQLQLAVNQDQAKIASLTATMNALNAELTPGRGGVGGAVSLTSAQEVRLAQLAQTYTTAADTYQQVQTNYEQAVASTATDPIQLSRVDTAVAGNWPVAPKRYLFLAMGLLLGVVAGVLLSARAAHRRNETLFAIEWDEPLSSPVAPLGRWVATSDMVPRSEPTRVASAGQFGSAVGLPGDAGRAARYEVFSRVHPTPTVPPVDGNRQNGSSANGV